MAETTADVRRDIELTRERMSSTLAELEQKLNLMQIVRDNPWPSLALAVGAGVLLSGSSADVKAAAATVGATKGASSKIGSALDEMVASLVTGFHGAMEERVTSWVGELKNAIGAPMTSTPRSTAMSTGGSGMTSGMGTGTGAGMNTGPIGQAAAVSDLPVRAD